MPIYSEKTRKIEREKQESGKESDDERGNGKHVKKLLKQISTDGAALLHISAKVHMVARCGWAVAGPIRKSEMKNMQQQKLKRKKKYWNMPLPPFLSLSIFVKVPFQMDQCVTVQHNNLCYSAFIIVASAFAFQTSSLWNVRRFA